jgi:GNAT superfamily N-acetyltransferase
MDRKPKCIIITGRAGAGKTTLAEKLAHHLWMPVISRDEIKEGYVKTFGVKHDELPPETDGFVTNLFFEIVCQHLTGNVSVVIEAAFQHKVWESRMPRIIELSHPYFIICTIDEDIAAQRHLQRGLADPRREFCHNDKRVTLYRATGEIGTPQPYAAPDFDVPTIYVSTENDYAPTLDEVERQVMAAYTIRKMVRADIEDIAVAFAAENKTREQYERYFAENQTGGRVTLVATVNESVIGYTNVLWQSGYMPFLSDGIPEINDLNVVAEFRNRGIGRALILEAEQVARDAGKAVMGIGVGLTPDYAAAQYLYPSLGYVSNGRGVRKTQFGDEIYFTKRL